MKSAAAIAFDYRPSRWLVSAIAAVSVLALISIAICGLDIALKLVLIALTVAYAAHVVWKLSHPPFVRVMWHSAGHWRVGEEGGREQVGELVRATVLGASITLVLRTHARRTAKFLLLPDNCDGDTQRKLRVRLTRADSIDVDR